MGEQRQTGLQRARDIRQRQNQHRLLREQRIETGLAMYFTETQRAERILRQARERAARIMAAAEQASRDPRLRAALALAALEECGETRTAIAEMTGLTRGKVREILDVANRAIEAEIVERGWREEYR